MSAGPAAMAQSSAVRTASSSPPARADWETFAHGADIGVRGYGATPGEAFEHAAVAMTSAVTDPALIRLEREVAVACEAPDLEVLFVDWLNRLVALMAIEGMLFGSFEVVLSLGQLRGRAFGEPIDPARHQPAVEVKGATFTELRVGQDEDGRWRAQCIVDV